MTQLNEYFPIKSNYSKTIFIQVTLTMSIIVSPLLHHNHPFHHNQ